MLQRMAHIHELEMLRQEALRKTESITRDEEVRLWQLRLVTMRHENTDLREQLGLREFNISLLVRDTDQLRLDLEDGKQTVRAQEARLKKQDIEIASLKVLQKNLIFSDLLHKVFHCLTHVSSKDRDRIHQRVYAGLG